jgi:hypothetical protein
MAVSSGRGFVRLSHFGKAAFCESPPGEHLDGGVPEMDLDTVAIELDLVDPTFANGHLMSVR